MTEKPGYWRWLLQDIVEKISAIPGIIRSPSFEEAIGFLGAVVFVVFWLNKRHFVLEVLSLLSCLVMKHGEYRKEKDC